MRLLLWCAAGAALVQVLLQHWATFDGFSPIFWQLLKAYDTHGNLLLVVLAVCAFLLRRQPGALAAVQLAAQRPWTIAALVFPLLCLGSLRVYHDHALSMDEYAAVFQAKAFAAGKLAGQFPPELLDRLIPNFLQGIFLTVSRATGEVSATYWPGFALLLAPFAWLGIPWAANPAIGALTIPALHRLVRQLTGSQEAAGWAVALTAASPAFIVASISYYSMQAHLLCNLLYALLLLQPSVSRALLAGVVGSLALNLHQPVSHMLFALPFFVWLALRPGSRSILAALLAGYLPLSLALGVGWHYHLVDLAHAAQAGQAAAPEGASHAIWESMFARFAGAFTLPQPATIEARIAGLSKIWTWGAAGLMVLAAWGFMRTRTLTGTKLLGASLLATFIGFFFFSRDQGHGWGYRYIHSAWFVMPVLGAIALPAAGKNQDDLRRMAAWALVLSLVAANALRLVQVESFVTRHLAQVPPLARAADPQRREVVFVELRSGFYAQDLVQNDPFLRGPRIVMVHAGAQANAQLMAQRFPEYAKNAEGAWGELWTRRP